MKDKVCVPSGTNDSAGIRHVKKAIANDLDKIYQDLSVEMLMIKATFLDPRMKSLTHLPANEQEAVIDSVINEIVSSKMCSLEPHSAVVPSDCDCDCDSGCCKCSTCPKNSSRSTARKFFF